MYKDNKEYGREMLTLEKGIIFESQERLDLMSRMIQKFGKNTLILFSDIKNEYGKNICKKLQEWNRDTYYIDGGIESEQRDEYKDAMEKLHEYTIIELENTTIKVDQLSYVNLSNGNKKRAKDLNEDDDICNNWIKENS
jgi:hypothetical protein